MRWFKVFPLKVAMSIIPGYETPYDVFHETVRGVDFHLLLDVDVNRLLYIMRSFPIQNPIPVATLFSSSSPFHHSSYLCCITFQVIFHSSSIYVSHTKPSPEQPAPWTAPSISLRPVNDINHLLPPFSPIQIDLQYLKNTIHIRLPQPTDMRRKDTIWGIP